MRKPDLIILEAVGDLAMNVKFQQFVGHLRREAAETLPRAMAYAETAELRADAAAEYRVINTLLEWFKDGAELANQKRGINHAT